MKRALKPLRVTPPRTTYHVLLAPQWVRATPATALLGTSRRVSDRWAWGLRLSAAGVELGTPAPYADAGQLAALLPTLAPPRKGLTVWLPRGWEDLVGSGLAALVEAGAYKHRWACLDGNRVMFAGRLGKRRLDITSLSAWTGGAWDAWAEAAREMAARVKDRLGPLDGADPADPNTDATRVALGTVLIVLAGVDALGLGWPRLAIGAQSRVWWQTWGGLTVQVARGAPGRRRGERPLTAHLLCAPMPMRPFGARIAEPHACHGLAREQYVRGHVGAPVHVLDLQSAYLLALAHGRHPAVFYRTRKHPSVAALAQDADRYVALALVRLEGTASPYPVCRHNNPRRAVGTYWAWLAGPELDRALREDVVAACWAVHLWHPAEYTAGSARMLLGVADQLEKADLQPLRPFWRALYAALVGGWAKKQWEWRPVNRASQLGNWATWTMAGADPTELERWRVVAGRVERCRFAGEAPYALPLAYACVTARVRCHLDAMRSLIGPEYVLATASDALWLTEAGLQRYRGLTPRQTGRDAVWRVKDSFDDAWLDGSGRAVVLKGGLRFPLLPGVPAGVALADDGAARWERAAPWTDGTGAGPDAPQRRRVATWDGGALCHRNAGPLEAVRPWLRLCQPKLDESLLGPYDPKRAQADADG